MVNLVDNIIEIVHELQIFLWPGGSKFLVVEAGDLLHDLSVVVMLLLT